MKPGTEYGQLIVAHKEYGQLIVETSTTEYGQLIVDHNSVA